MDFEALIDILKELIRHPSVVGAEHSFFRVLQRSLEERGATVTWYEGLLVAHGEKPDSSMFSAHIDRHGLMCTGPNEFQYAAFVAGSRSDLLGNSVSETMMNKIAKRFDNESVIAYEPWSGSYLGTGEITGTYICDKRNNLIFELEGLEDLVAGTPVAFSDRLRIENDRFVGQIDNVLSTAILVHLFSLGFQGTAFFTAEEETGTSWRYLLEWFRRFGGSTNELIVLDTTPFTDVVAADQQNVVLRHFDANAEFNKRITKALELRCRKLGIRFTYKDEYIDILNKQREKEGQPPFSYGSTELGRITAASDGLVHGTTLQIPTTEYHTMDESASIESCGLFIDLLMDIAEDNGLGVTHIAEYIESQENNH